MRARLCHARRDVRCAQAHFRRIPRADVLEMRTGSTVVPSQDSRQDMKDSGVNRAISLIAILSLVLTASAGPGARRVEFKDTVLRNGLRVITVEDHNAPVIALALTYDVGSRNERKGRTGFAHLFEHMMFKGSENVGNGEHSLLISNNGGGLNAA